jgi:hypothetical protein
MTFFQVGKNVDTAHIQTASRLLTEQGIKHVLVGTAGLVLHGRAPKGHPADDIDFLVTKAPYVKEPLPKEDASTSDSVATMIDGVKCDFIVTNFWSNNKRMRKYFTKNPTILSGIPVADVADILGLKLSAARKKDFQYIAQWTREYGELPKRPKKGFWSFL